MIIEHTSRASVFHTSHPDDPNPNPVPPPLPPSSARSTFNSAMIYSARTGVRPDIITSHHCMPSRMTLGLLIEGLASKCALLAQLFADSTPYNRDLDIPSLQAGLEMLGFKGSGTEPMVSPVTGRVLLCEVYLVPLDYMKLAQHVCEDKAQWRTIGAINARTRQPPAGKSRGGGLRVGEMEKDCLVASGCSLMLGQVMKSASDGMDLDVCSACGLPAHPKSHFAGPRLPHCRVCRRYAGIRRVNVPYSLVWIMHVLLAMHIRTRLLVK